MSTTCSSRRGRSECAAVHEGLVQSLGDASVVATAVDSSQGQEKWSVTRMGPKKGENSE